MNKKEILDCLFVFCQVTGDYFFNEQHVFILLGFFVPFGWKYLAYLQSFFPLPILGTFWFWIIYGIVKLALSMFIGIPAFIYQLVKTILTQNKINKLK